MAIVFGTSSGLWRVPEEGGPPEQLTQLEEGENHHYAPHALPDGRGVLFTVATGWGVRGRPAGGGRPNIGCSPRGGAGSTRRAAT